MRSKTAVAKAVAFFVFSMPAFYAWSFYFGGYAKWTELKDGFG
jgi:hypothetical protein